MVYRGRYAPSPTGALHLGNVRTALLAWLDARAHHGTFVLRLEDLDPQRSSTDAAKNLLDDLRWLGIDWDEGLDDAQTCMGRGPHAPYTQNERSYTYTAAIARLVDSGRAFACSCSRAEVARASGAPHAGEDGPRYPGTCRERPTHPERATSVRLRVGDGSPAFVDRVHGPQAFDVAGAVGDFVIRRVDGVAAYQLACAFDDGDMAITHVVRGDDLLASTPRQLLVLDALGLPKPSYAHVPLLLGEDGHRLAKRSGSQTIRALRERGAAPETIVGFLAKTAGLGDGGPCRVEELVADFDLATLSREPAVVTIRDIDALLR